MTGTSTQTNQAPAKGSTALATASRRTLVRARRYAPWIAIGFTVLLTATTLTIGWMVRESMREMTQKSVQSTLAANVAGLQRWAAEQLAHCQQIVAHDNVRQQARAVLSQPSSAKSDMTSTRRLRETIEQQIADSSVRWLLLDGRGRVVAGHRPELFGAVVPIPDDVQQRLDVGESVMCRPQIIQTTNAESTTETALLFLTPINEGVLSLGSIAVLHDPSTGFTESLNTARMGSSGETYAIDRRGVLMSRSRFEGQLHRSGRLPEDRGSPLNVTIREMGETKSSTQGAQEALTLMADQATRGASGSDVTGYDNYLGTSVVGAWQWMPQYGMAVATEMQYSEAYGALRILRNAFIGALALVALAGIGVFSLLRLIRRVDGRPSKRELARRLGQYDLGKVIGSGGMGSVYHGRHHLLKRDVAIKVLEHTEVTNRSLSRFEREVQMTAKLRHPNTIEIYDYGRTPEGTFFYVMEYVEGISLQQLVDYYGRQPPERVIYLLLQVCGSLAEAHQQSMVHRDIKPANILLAARAGLYDLVKVLDFGLVKEFDRETVQLTRTESMTGTPMYMSPETVRDASKADPRSDLYSIGAVGYTLLTGLPTFDGPSAADICAKQLHEEPVLPAKRIGAELPEDLQNVLMSCLRKDPDDRPSSMTELADALMHCRDASRWTVGDACLWWESVFDGPRDDLGHFDDNSRPGGSASPPINRPARREPSSKSSASAGASARPGHDTKVDQPLRDAIDKPPEKTAR